MVSELSLTVGSNPKTKRDFWKRVFQSDHHTTSFQNYKVIFESLFLDFVVNILFSKPWLYFVKILIKSSADQS